MSDTAVKRSTRPAFLRRVAVTLGAAVGVAAFPSVAHASNCCEATTQCTSEPPCGDGKIYYWCNCGGVGNYCLCWDDVGNCFSGPCR
jgi:hypothetical protein